MTRLTLRLSILFATITTLIIALALAVGAASPPGLQVSFVQNPWLYHDEQSYHLYDVDQRLLLDLGTVHVADGLPAPFVWSPDSTQLFAYSQASAVTIDANMLHLGQPFRTIIYGDFDIETPAVWSPSGDLIGVTMFDNSGRRVLRFIDVLTARVVNAETAPRLLMAQAFAWSPDGDYLLFRAGFSRRMPLERARLIDMRHGGILAPLTDDEPGDMTFNAPPTWSPDGRFVILNNAPINGVSDEGLRTYVLDIATRTTRLIHPDLPAMNAVWSPDGRTIAFDTRIWTRQNNALTDFGGAGIYLVAWPERTAQFLPAPCIQPQWSPDSTHILCWNGDERQSQYYLLRVRDGHVTPLSVGAIPPREIVYAIWRPTSAD